MSNYPPLGPPGVSRAQLVAQGWDRATYGGIIVPGLCRVKGSIKVKFDRKRKKGSHGGRPTFHGLDGQPFFLKIGVWQQVDLDAADAFCQAFLPNAKSTVKSQPSGLTPSSASAFGAQATSGAISGAYGLPLVLDHASIRLFGTVFAVVVDATSWEPKPEWGVQGRETTVEMLHWIPEVPNATVTPKTGGAARDANASFQTALRAEKPLFTRDIPQSNLPPSQRTKGDSFDGLIGAPPKLTRT